MSAKFLTDSEVKAKGDEPVGSVRPVLIMNINGMADSVVYKKAKSDTWFDSLLTDTEVSDILQNMDTTTTPVASKKRQANLIPSADVYLDNGFNVLLIGMHGTGKTVSIQELAKERGFKMKYFSCSTLDPFTDIVGVPTPRDYCPECKLWFKETEVCTACNGRTVESLKMVRPREVDEAEVLFFDELNRADSKTLNAIFEIIQFRSINGEPLPNLKACWAAMNPPDDEQNYQVEQLDPALLDRFDVYIDITAKPSVIYMEQHMPMQIAVALKRWWDDHENAIKQKSKDAHSDYISPRRLEKIGLVWCATKNRKSVEASLPRGGNFELQKLIDMLKQAQKSVDAGDTPVAENEIVFGEDNDPDLSGSGMGDRPATQFTYTPANIQLQATEVADYLEKHPLHDATHKAVVGALETQVGGVQLVTKYSQVLNALNAASLEALVTKFPAAKVGMMRNGFLEIYKDNRAATKKLTRLHSVLSKAAGSPPTGWPTSL